MHERGISARKKVIEKGEYDTYSVANFKEHMKKVNLNLILGKETPYYKKLFIEGYEPGTFTLHDRKNQPDFLSEDERDYTQWLKNGNYSPPRPQNLLLIRLYYPLQWL
ncbi:MAG: hypothetical protein KAV25_06185 [Methanophagales archaeon]|nr:hypothetical protein [Methanophagales archaeon]